MTPKSLPNPANDPDGRLAAWWARMDAEVNLVAHGMKCQEWSPSPHTQERLNSIRKIEAAIAKVKTILAELEDERRARLLDFAKGII